MEILVLQMEPTEATPVPWGMIAVGGVALLGMILLRKKREGDWFRPRGS